MIAGAEDVRQLVRAELRAAGVLAAEMGDADALPEPGYSPLNGLTPSPSNSSPILVATRIDATLSASIRLMM